MAYADIKLGSTFDAKGFKQAATASEKLGKTVKNLAGAFGLAFGAVAVARFGAASLKAFTDDEKAATKLNIAVKNLGLEFESARINTFIQGLEKTSGVMDDSLRPAFQALLTTTGSVTKSQELLNLAIDVAAGSGENLTTVTDDLSQAYVGNTKGLKKYHLGLTVAELKASKFADVQTKITNQFTGSNAAHLLTYAGKLDQVKVSYDNMQETIGGALLDSFALLAGDSGIGGATSAMEAFGIKSGQVIYGIAAALGKLNVKGSGSNASSSIFHDLYIAFGGAIIESIASFGKAQKAKNTPLFFPTSGGTAQQNAADEKARKAAEAAALKRAKDLSNIQNKTLKTAKDTAALKKVAGIFDLTQIQIAAALKGKISEEEKIRLLLMQAIADEDVKKAETLTKKLEDIQAKNAKIAADLLAIGEAKDPFSTWAGSLSLALAALSKLGVGMSAISSIMIPGVTYNPTQNADRNYDDKVAAAKALAEKAATEKAAADKAAADANAAAVLAAAGDKAAADKAAAADAAAAAAAILAGSGTTFNSSQNADRNYDDALAAAAAALATAPTNGSPGAGVTYNPTQNADRNYTDANATQTPSIVINVEGSVLNGDDFDEIVSRAMLNNIRRGYSQNPAGVIP